MKTHSLNESKFKDTNFISWLKEWNNRTLMNNGSKEKSINLMKKTNPNFIPRNHKVEKALKNAHENNYQDFRDLLNVVGNPYQNIEKLKDYKKPANLDGIKYQTFCGT
jgi:uncharacterized protein YdiU (UPF0061 family)